MADTKVITLRRPVSADPDGKVVYSEITLREPVAREIEESGGSMVGLIAVVAAIPRRAAEQLSARDYTEACAFLNTFLTGSPETGETS